MQTEMHPPRVATATDPPLVAARDSAGSTRRRPPTVCVSETNLDPTTSFRRAETSPWLGHRGRLFEKLRTMRVACFGLVPVNVQHDRERPVAVWTDKIRGPTLGRRGKKRQLADCSLIDTSRPCPSNIKGPRIIIDECIAFLALSSQGTKGSRVRRSRDGKRLEEGKSPRQAQVEQLRARRRSGVVVPSL